jgi:hypothetical protein
MVQDDAFGQFSDYAIMQANGLRNYMSITCRLHILRRGGCVWMISIDAETMILNTGFFVVVRFSD